MRSASASTVFLRSRHAIAMVPGVRRCVSGSSTHTRDAFAPQS